MGNFRPNNRDRGFSGGRFRDRDSRSFERRRPQMHQATCSKCGKQCEVPFRPTGEKPVYCSDCFRKEGDSNSSSRNNSSSSGISQEQYKEINKKLDKILGILQMIEFEDKDSEDDSEDEEESEDESEEEETESSN